jgi:glycosyltransferase involved in cell wall biosynthesis
MTIDITIPVLNEAATLDRQIRILYNFLENDFAGTDQWQIVIADNGSTDSTLEIAEQLSSELPKVTYVKVPKRGVGLALKTSWGQSQADIVGYMDLDLATDLKHFPEAYQALSSDGYDLVYATRLHRDSKVIGRTMKREIASRVFNTLLKLYLRVGFSDGMCGFKFLHRNKYQALNQLGAQNDGWFFSTELLVCAEWLNYRIKELPVTWTDDVSSSQVKIIPLAIRYIKSMQALKAKRPQTSKK